jgi:hypothetical protein
MRKSPSENRQKSAGTETDGALEELGKFVAESVKQMHPRHTSKAIQAQFDIPPRTAERVIAGNAGAALLLTVLKALRPETWNALFDRANDRLGTQIMEAIKNETVENGAADACGMGLLNRAQAFQEAAVRVSKGDE